MSMTRSELQDAAAKAFDGDLTPDAAQSWSLITDMGWLMMAVPEDQGGLGLGRAIMDAAENWLKDRGVWKLNLLIRDTNLPVKAFYESIGYSDEPRAAMAKWLTEKPEGAK